MSDASEADLNTAVASLFRAYLHREPDAAGLADSVALLKQFGGLSGIGRLASVFEESTERAIRDFMPTCVRLITMSHGLPDELDGLQIVSLGSHCATSMILKKNQLKRFSGPFDWIFSTPAMVRHCITDRFATYLDPRHHRHQLRVNNTGEIEATSEHLYYQAECAAPGPVFNHRDITVERHREYYQRCVNRFMGLVHGAHRVQFVQCVVAGVVSEEAALEEFRATATLLNDVMPNASLAMFHLRLKGGIMPEMAVLDEAGQHRLFQMDTVSILGALEFHERIDEIALLRALRWHVRNKAPATASQLEDSHPA